MNERFCARHTDFETRAPFPAYRDGPNRLQALEQQQQHQRSQQVAETVVRLAFEAPDRRVYGTNEWAFAD